MPASGSNRNNRSVSAQDNAACSTANRPEIIETVAPSAAHRAIAVCTTDGVNRSTWQRPSRSRRKDPAT